MLQGFTLGWCGAGAVLGALATLAVVSQGDLTPATDDAAGAIVAGAVRLAENPQEGPVNVYRVVREQAGAACQTSQALKEAVASAAPPRIDAMVAPAGFTAPCDQDDASDGGVPECRVEIASHLEAELEAEAVADAIAEIRAGRPRLLDGTLLAEAEQAGDGGAFWDILRGVALATIPTDECDIQIDSGCCCDPCECDSCACGAEDVRCGDCGQPDACCERTCLPGVAECEHVPSPLHPWAESAEFEPQCEFSGGGATPSSVNPYHSAPLGPAPPREPAPICPSTPPGYPATGCGYALPFCEMTAAPPLHPGGPLTVSWGPMPPLAMTPPVQVGDPVVRHLREAARDLAMRSLALEELNEFAAADALQDLSRRLVEQARQRVQEQADGSNAEIARRLLRHIQGK